MALGEAAFGQVLLVVVFGRVKGFRRGDFGDDLRREGSRFFEGFFRRECGALLFIGMVIDGRALLRANVWPLSVHGWRVVRFPCEFRAGASLKVSRAVGRGRLVICSTDGAIYCFGR